MRCRQTKDNLKDVILDVLRAYGVELGQVYTIAHDNGSNMVATVKILKNMLQKCNSENSSVSMILDNEEVRHIFEKPDESYDVTSDETQDEHDELTDEFSIASDNTAEEDDFTDGRQGEENFTTPGIDEIPCEIEEILDSTRCAAHTAQLAVWDVLKPYKERLAKIQKLVLKLRHREYQKCFHIHNAHLPPVANDTRWNGKFLMLKSLLNQRQFFNLLKTSFPETGKKKCFCFFY